MRRMMLLMVAVSFLGFLAGCHGIHSHGICDCDQDDYCCSRSPWINYGAPSTSEVVPVPPTKLPEGKKN